MTIKLRDVYTSRYYKHGTSYGFILPPDIRAVMGLRIGDVMMMNYSHGVLWVVRASAEQVIDRKKVAAVFDELFRKDGDRNAVNG